MDSGISKPGFWRQLVCCAAVVLATAPLPAAADGLPLLPEGDHADWVAVGRLNVAGFKSRTACTGTLVAPDVVLTAAHCVTGFDRTPHAAGNVHFVAGWVRGTYIWHSPAASVDVHPGYETAEGAARMAHDLALVTLATAAPPDLVAPIPVARIDLAAQTAHGIIGYQRSRTAMLSARFDCAPSAAQGPLHLIDCPVIPGLSGSPVLTQTPQGWHVSAIISAQTRRDGRAMAIAAAPDTWVMDHLATRTASH